MSAIRRSSSAIRLVALPLEARAHRGEPALDPLGARVADVRDPLGQHALRLAREALDGEVELAAEPLRRLLARRADRGRRTAATPPRRSAPPRARRRAASCSTWRRSTSASASWMRCDRLGLLALDLLAAARARACAAARRPRAARAAARPRAPRARRARSRPPPARRARAPARSRATSACCSSTDACSRSVVALDARLDLGHQLPLPLRRVRSSSAARPCCERSRSPPSSASRCSTRRRDLGQRVARASRSPRARARRRRGAAPRRSGAPPRRAARASRRGRGRASARARPRGSAAPRCDDARRAARLPRSSSASSVAEPARGRGGVANAARDCDEDDGAERRGDRDDDPALTPSMLETAPGAPGARRASRTTATASSRSAALDRLGHVAGRARVPRGVARTGVESVAGRG